MKLINADEAIINFSFEWGDISPTCEEVIEFLKRQPTIDAVPVVRCRECKYCRKMIGNSYHYCVTHNTKMYAEDFCSYGERKEGAE